MPVIKSFQFTVCCSDIQPFLILFQFSEAPSLIICTAGQSDKRISSWTSSLYTVREDLIPRPPGPPTPPLELGKLILKIKGRDTGFDGETPL